MIKKNETPQPRLTIDIGAKFFLAVALRKSADHRLIFIYTLFLAPDKLGAYSMTPQTEVNTFDNPQDADIYFKTINDTIKCNYNNAAWSAIEMYLGHKIKDFNQMIR